MRAALVLALVFALSRHASAFDCVAQAADKICTSSNAESDIQAAINHLRDTIAEHDWTLVSGSAGDTIALSNQLVLNVGRRFTWKSASVSNRATINSTYPFGQAIVISNSSHLVTIKDFRLTSWLSSNSGIGVYGTGEIFHLTNLYINGGGRFFLWTSGPVTNGGGEGPFGLIDNCEITDSGMYIRQNLDAPDAQWTNSHTVTWGTRKAVFVEDCIINGNLVTGFTDGDSAGKLVVRYNTFNNARVGNHGRDSSNSPPYCKNGFLSFELYANRFNVSTAYGAPLFLIRSGTALVYDNSLSVTGGGSVGVGVQLQTHCAGHAWYCGPGGECCHDSDTCTPLSGPLQYDEDWPDEQQAGYPEPVRVWNNCQFSGADCVPGTTAMPGGWAAGDSAFTQSNREYFVSNDSSAARVGYTAFTWRHPLNTGAPLAAPSNNTPPGLSGVATQGQTLTMTEGSWSGYPTPTKAKQWVACDDDSNNCADVSGQTGFTFALTSTQVGKKIKPCVTATNSQGQATTCGQLSGVVAAPGAEDRVVNGTFEAGGGATDYNDPGNTAYFDGWTIMYGSGWVQRTTGAHGGSYAYKLYYNGVHSRISQPFIPSAHGSVMTLSFWSANDTSGQGIMYDVYCVTHGDFFIQPVEIDKFSAWPGYGKTTQTFTIGTHTTAGVVAGCASTFLTFHSDGLSAGATMKLDDVMLVPPAPPTGATPPVKRLRGAKGTAAKRRPR